MRFHLRAAAAAVVSGVLLPLVVSSARAADGFSARLQQALNGGEAEALEALLSPELLEPFQSRYSRFLADFPNATWTVRPLTTRPDGRRSLELAVRGEREGDGLRYRLDASQRLAVRIEAGRMLEQEVLAEQSLLHSGAAAVPVTLAIPDAVLTGSRYDVDVIVDQPLGKAVVAGGLLSLTPEQVDQQIRPDLSLEPMGGGGLFKTVQAPQLPGLQNWAAMLVHPQGVITITKRVRVVSDRNDLSR